MNAQPMAVPLKDIKDNPFQTKERDYSDIETFALTIAEHGLQQTPRARAVNGHYELKFGHRRLRAFQWLRENWKARGLADRYDGYKTMPLIVEELSDDDMFDHMVVENVHRKDLKPTEEAALLKQWLERNPNATSKEAGVVFGKNDATIRGMVRLLDLPLEAQRALDEGKITQNTARSLLSMQKVAPTAIVEVLEEIEKEKNEGATSKWSGQRTQEEIVLDLLEEQSEVKELWWDSRGKEKPRAGGSDGWLLDAKNFPNHFLPALTPADAAVALGAQDDQIALEMLGGMLNIYPVMHNDIDEVQNTANFKHLNELNPAYGEKVLHLINPPACNACPFYTTLRGTHYCGMKTCYTRKSQAWDRKKLHEASKSLGIAIYDPTADGAAFKVLEENWMDGNKGVALFKRRGKDLRLALMADIDRKKDQHGYEGVPPRSVVLVVGKSMQDLQVEKKEERVEVDRTHELDEFIFKQRNLLNWHAAEYIASLFDGINDHAFHMLKEAFKFQWSHHAINELELDEEEETDRRTLAFMLVMEAEQGPRAATCVKHAEGLVAIAKTWGVKIPARFLKQAEQADAEIKELKKSVAAETRNAKKA